MPGMFHRLLGACAGSFLTVTAVCGADALQLIPWKDEMFQVPAVRESRHDGDYLILDYQSKRDINGRDTIPEKRAKDERVSLEVNSVQKDSRLKTRSGEIRYHAVGRTAGASIIVIYFHGKGGNRGQGIDDWTFGGNFNRLKNLVAGSGGLYLSTDNGNFSGRSANQITDLLLHHAEASPGARIILAGGSAGGRIIYQLARKEELVPHLGGIVFLGSFPDGVFTGSAAWRARVPVYIGHGSSDYISYIEKMEGLYLDIREKSPGYPVRMERFETGSHGTPIRMIDWRKTINWQLSQR